MKVSKLIWGEKQTDDFIKALKGSKVENIETFTIHNVYKGIDEQVTKVTWEEE